MEQRVMAKTSEAKIRANAKYNKANTTQFSIRLNFKTDADVIEKLKAEPNVRAYLISLIRKDINGGEV